jgi:hypothetical protein
MNDEMNGRPPAEDAGSDTKKVDRLSADWIQADIARALELRRDYYKYSIGVSTALLAFTTSFPPTLSRVSGHSIVLLAAWPGLAVAIICGIVVHYLWAWFFISFRDFDNRGDSQRGRRRRALLNSLRRLMEIVQVVALIVGVLGTAVFAITNFEQIETKAPFREQTGKSEERRLDK